MGENDTSDWQPGDPIHQPPTPDAELTAIETIYGALAALDSEAQGRVIRWAHDRYVVHSPQPTPDEETER